MRRQLVVGHFLVTQAPIFEPVSHHGMDIVIEITGRNIPQSSGQDEENSADGNAAMRNPIFVFGLLPSNFDLRNNEAICDARNSLDKYMNSALEKVSRELGFERPVTFHQARHSFAVMAINKGMRVEVLSKLLGRSSIISTEKTYARFLGSTVDDEIRKVMEW